MPTISSTKNPFAKISDAVRARFIAIFSSKKGQAKLPTAVPAPAATAPAVVVSRPSAPAAQAGEVARLALIKQFNSFTDPEARAAFYATNRDAMFAPPPAADPSTPSEAELTAALDMLSPAELAALVPLVEEAERGSSTVSPAASQPAKPAPAIKSAAPKALAIAPKTPAAAPVAREWSIRGAIIEHHNSITDPAERARFYADHAEFLSGNAPAGWGASLRKHMEHCRTITDPAARARYWSDYCAEAFGRAPAIGGAERRARLEHYRTITDPAARAQYWSEYCAPIFAGGRN